MSGSAPTSTPSPTDETGARGRDPGSRLWWAAAVLTVVATAAIYYLVSLSAIAPRTPWDENGVLELGRALSGDDNVTPMWTSGYYPGWPVLIAPIWWFTSSAATVYLAANTLSNVIGLATIVPLALIGRRIGLTTPQAVTAGALTMMLPSNAGLADYVLSEQLLGFLIVWAAYFVFRLDSRPSLGNALGLLAFTLGAVFTHPRALVVAPVVLIWLVGRAVLQRRSRRTLLLVVLVVLVTVPLVKLGADGLASLNTRGGFSQGEGLMRTLRNFEPFTFVKVLFTETWAQLVATLGLIALGAVAVTARAYVEVVRLRTFGPMVFVFGLSLAGALLAFFAGSREGAKYYGSEPRLDSWLYTRYINPFIIVAVLVGVAVLFKVVSARLLAVSIALAAFVAGVVVLVFADSLPTWGSTYGPGNVAGLRAWEGMWPTGQPYDIPLRPTLENGSRFWLVASLFLGVVMLAYAGFTRSSRVMVPFLVALTAVYAAMSNPSLAREYPAHIEAAVKSAESVAGDGYLSLDIDIKCRTGRNSRPTTVNWLGYWMSPRDVDLVDPTKEDFDADLIVACVDWDRAQSLGAQPLADSENYGFQVWVPAGSLQDELEQAGELASAG
ncbi:hypothetical protein H9L10_02645 [Phycicoccus endophyticus]|uniref:Glycosyltransferase family 39 protein n=1 Tax=Phycicoccus endophyticus TaxID=1690220 RepID=A0A7G9R320_9MICO|nr:hypothetical protein [Phycicoccus endophyticus]NHI20290.1 hypothetical protein [Phycicoccus endophyticus]QNN49995.1 hypothetical protein H9L10_02645 [Phycicoccus endophyticus]GGL28982.1 hypothetical protein GCM10012283_09070 [Phycicoccus endophyticus]